MMANGDLLAMVALVATWSAVSVESKLTVSLKPTSVQSQLKPIAYDVLNSPKNQYVHVALSGSATLSYVYQSGSAKSSLRLMNWSIMPFNRPIPKNDARYRETWHRLNESTAVTTLHLTKIDETISRQSFKAVAYVIPRSLTSISGIVHFIKEKAYTFAAVQERQLNGKIRLKASVVQGNLPVSLTVWNSTSKKVLSLIKVTSKPDVYVTLPVIDSLKHSNESQFTFVVDNDVRIDTIKVNVILRNFGPLLGCQVFDSIDVNSTKTTSQQNRWLRGMFPVYFQFVTESANIKMCGSIFLDCKLMAKNGWESKIYHTRFNFRLPCEDGPTAVSLPTSATPSSPLTTTEPVTSDIPSTIAPSVCTPALCPVQDRPNLTTPAVSYATFDGQDVNESADVALIASDASNITLTVAFKDGRTVSFQKRIQVITADESPTVSCQTNQTYQTALIVVSLTFFGLTCAVSLYFIYVRCITKKKNSSTPQPQSDNSHAVVESECMHVNPSYLSSQGASVA
ncbi:uncharacterized protein [Oscarella lobularis]|uniref:uncharacterized protein isoform X2 n=1 Tax=Oscarella lobularis TaxID=121494 RepID=UPI00331339BF